jgi:tRNA G18 (ribose-2'-O)-methylase SpoU
MFATVLHNLKSPENVGIVVRTHVAFGGGPLVIVGSEPWRFKKRAQAFSRRLERQCQIVHIPTDDELFKWCDKESFTPVAIEIAEHSELLTRFRFPINPAIIVGNEGVGLPENVLSRIKHVVTIPQFGPVECLNAAVSCCIAIYECNRNRTCDLRIEGHKFLVKQSGHQTIKSAR